MADPLVTVEELERRLGHTLTGQLAEQAEAALEDASAVARDIAKPALDTVVWPDTAPLVAAAVISMARRALNNPLGLSGEAIDGHQWQASGQTGVFATRLEERAIRSATGKLGVVTVGLEGYLPLHPRHLNADVLTEIETEE